MWFMFVIPFIIFFVIFLGIVGSFFKSHHKTGEVKTSTFNTGFDTVSAYAENQPKNSQTQEKDQICEYCGSTIKAGENKCTACGAKLKTKK